MFFVMNLKKIIKLLLVLFSVCLHSTHSEVTTLNQQNIDDVLAKNKVVFMNFYADWCRFSNLLEPIFASAAEEIKKEFPQPGVVTLGKVDCDAQPVVAHKFHISKYPTLKLIINGQTAKREFRGQRSKESIVEFIRKQLISPLQECTSHDELKNKINKAKATIVAYLHDKNGNEFQNLEKIAFQLRDDCDFVIAHGDAFLEQSKAGAQIVFKPQNKELGEVDESYSSDPNDSPVLSNWIQQKCVPPVREITFQNAEELTEEGLPFLILFYKKDDDKSVEDFTKVIQSGLKHHKGSVNCLKADGEQFQHPLHHLGKSMNDLPVIAIDSFKHMYLFKDFKDLHTPDKLFQFIDDMHSGKLHREFHYGPDPTQAAESENDGNKQKQTTNPPKSVFKDLLPSDKRYTLLENKDEL